MRIRKRLTARMRLTVLYGLLFLVASGALLGIDYALVHRHMSGSVGAVTAVQITDSGLAAKNGKSSAEAKKLLVSSDTKMENGQLLNDYLRSVKRDAARAAEHQLLEQSGIAMGIVTVLAVGFGYVMAGRALRPVHAVSAAARRIGVRALHERIPVSGPPDEMRELAETVNDMLARLEASFAAQRNFVANASHELRTPITTQRALIEVAAADPGAGDVLAETAPSMLQTLDRQERLVDGLLALARADHALSATHPVDLCAIVERVLDSARPHAADRGIVIDARLRRVVTTGDPVLLEIMVTNIIRNAIRHNVAGGRVTLRLGGGQLFVANDGAHYEQERLAELIEPFRRGTRDRTTADGVGLGLTIIAAVARAHSADLNLAARPAGGLEVRITWERSGRGIN